MDERRQPWRCVAPHAADAAEVLESLYADLARGLDDAEVMQRRAAVGLNELAPREPDSPWTIFLHQLAGPVTGLLLAAAAISLALRDWAEAVAILVVLAINTAIGFVTELRAGRSMQALRALGTEHQRVRRGGRPVVVPARELVPGDIVLLEEGDVATADVRLVTVADLAADESLLTGESVPIPKSHLAVRADAPVGDRTSMVFKGTAITRGAATGVVTATGHATELGEIATLAATAEPEESPLTRKLARLSRDLVLTVLAIAVVLAIGGIVEGQNPWLMLESAISLAVAAIPEGLPIVATLVLARGMLEMARRNAVIEKLSAVETLGATTVILTDKTGTLTENRMTVATLVTPGREIRMDAGHGLDAALTRRHDVETERLLTAAVLCNTAELGSAGEKGRGDPMEIALLAAARDSGLMRQRLVADLPEMGRVAFDSTTKIMATAHSLDGAVLLAVKGAPEAVLARTGHVVDVDKSRPMTKTEHRQWLDRVHRLGQQGLRVIAIAERRGASFTGHIGDDLTLLGLVALRDPPRADVPAAIAACRTAGIKVVMVTGDHAGTAAAIARDIGFGPGPIKAIEGHRLADDQRHGRPLPLDADVFARVSPRQKLTLVSAYQAAGHVVAMTGDGVNDAPALKKADIGIAMGERGTEVARQAAAMVLRDDSFPAIVEAVHQGRVIFGNIRRFVVYLLACNLSEVLIVSLAILSGLPLPLQPIQILFLNVVTDVFPAFALAAGEDDGATLRRPPRDPAEPLVARRHWIRIVAFGVLITAATLGAMFWQLAADPERRDLAATAAFLTLAMSQLWFVFNMIDSGEPVFTSSVVRNRYVWAALAFCAALLVVAVEIGSLARVLKIATPDWATLGAALGFSLAATGAGALVLRLLSSRPQRRLP